MNLIIRLLMLPIAFSVLIVSLILMLFGMFLILVMLPFTVLFGTITVNGKPLR